MMAKYPNLKHIFIALVGIILFLSYLPALSAGVVVYLPLVISGSQSTKTPTLTLKPTLIQTPTETPTPTITLTPTVTPTPTATSLSSGVTILQNDSSYVSNDGRLHVVGEIWNNSVNILWFPRINAYFFNNNGQEIANGFQYTYLQFIPIGDKTCFNISIQEPSGWSYYNFDTQIDMIYEGTLPNLTILNHSGSYNSTFGWYEIIGEVRNDGGTQIQGVAVVSTVYNTSGDVIGCGLDFVDSYNLYPGQTSPFKITLLGRDYNDVDSYRLQVSGSIP